jgi:hypothetical protein
MERNGGRRESNLQQFASSKMLRPDVEARSLYELLSGRSIF